MFGTVITSVVKFWYFDYKRRLRWYNNYNCRIFWVFLLEMMYNLCTVIINAFQRKSTKLYPIEIHKFCLSKFYVFHEVNEATGYTD